MNWMTLHGRTRSVHSSRERRERNAKQGSLPGRGKRTGREARGHPPLNRYVRIAMPGNVVLDSSIIAAIFFPEKISGTCLDIAENNDCTTVDLAYAEVANVAWKRVRHDSQDIEKVRSSLGECHGFIRETCQVIPAQDLIIEAYDVACSHRITVYDALFVAAAVRYGSPLVTADTKLGNVARKIVKVELVR
jgi:predicted nucleic acid-binding protein